MRILLTIRRKLSPVEGRLVRPFGLVTSNGIGAALDSGHAAIVMLRACGSDSHHGRAGDQGLEEHGEGLRGYFLVDGAQWLRLWYCAMVEVVALRNDSRGLETLYQITR